MGVPFASRRDVGEKREGRLRGKTPKSDEFREVKDMETTVGQKEKGVEKIQKN